MIFDVDGTLYRQAPVRRGTAFRFLCYALRHPAPALRAAAFLREYRRAQEQLRAVGSGPDQLRVACESTGTEYAKAMAYVQCWLEGRPLDLVAKAIYPGLVPFLSKATERGIKLAVVSDYPAEEKLRALGLDAFFCAVISASGPSGRRFKPAPDGILAVLEELAVAPSHAIYVGDRPDVDAAAAKAAGTACAILGYPPNPDPGGWLGAPDYFRLASLLGLN